MSIAIHDLVLFATLEKLFTADSFAVSTPDLLK
jgi:hypothetical protein